jgi:hypothetical protein
MCLGALFCASPAHAYMHMVTQGETLAQIALRVYGNPKFETVIAGANSLDAKGGAVIVPGMRIEILAPGHHRAEPGETWAQLALRFLGSDKRAETLARANQGVSWVPPVEGQEIEIPAVLSYIAGEGDSMAAISLRYLGDVNKGWVLDAYNFRKGSDALKAGEVVLIPLPDLQLTQAGKDEARRAGQTGEGAGSSHDAQKRAEAELPALLSDLRGGRYIDAVSHGNRLLGSGDLTKVQLAAVHRVLLEAYVALDAPGAARGACDAFRANADPKSPEVARLADPRLTSPKVRAVCAPGR